MNGYLLLAIELFLILAVCAVLAFLAGWFLSKRRRGTDSSGSGATASPGTAPLAAGSVPDMASGDTVRVYDESQYRAIEKRAVEAERRAVEAEARVDQVSNRIAEAEARLVAAEERSAQAEARAAEAEARAADPVTPEVASESAALAATTAGHDARIAELEALEMGLRTRQVFCRRNSCRHAARHRKTSSDALPDRRCGGDVSPHAFPDA